MGILFLSGVVCLEGVLPDEGESWDVGYMMDPSRPL